MALFRELRALPRAVWVVFGVTLVNRAGSMALAFLALYLTLVVRGSPTHTGLVLGSYGAGAIVAGPLATIAMRTVRPTTVMAVALTLSGALLVVFPLANGLLALATLTCAWGATAEAFRPAAFTWIAEEVGVDHQKQAFAVARLGVNLGMSVGSAVGGLLAERSFTLVFAADGATSLAAAALLVGALVVGRTARAPAARIDEAPSLPGSGPRFAVFLIGLALAAMVFFQASSTMPMYLVETLGLTASTYGFLSAGNAIAIILIELPLTSALAAWSHTRALATGAILLSLGFGAFGLVREVVGASVAVAVWTLGEMIFAPAAAAFAARAGTARRRGLAMGLYSSAWAAALMMGPALGVMSFESIGPARHWALTAMVGALAAVLLGAAARAPSHTTRSA